MRVKESRGRRQESVFFRIQTESAAFAPLALYEVTARHSALFRGHVAELFQSALRSGFRIALFSTSLSSANSPRSRAVSLIFEFILSP